MIKHRQLSGENVWPKASEWNSVVVGSNPAQVNFTIMYQIIPLNSRDYLKKTSIKINMVTDEGNSRNEIER